MISRPTLKSARKAILDLDPARADALLHEFETSRPETAADRDAIAQELQEIKALAEAALEGVALAHEQVKQLLARTQTLDTYDKSGNRQIRDMSIQIAKKF